MTASETTRSFFEVYSRALLARDADGIAELYAVPGVILFPGNALAVSSRAQTRAFFEQAFPQYDGVTATRTAIEIAASTASSIWADVTWHHDTGATERLMYQLVDDEGTWLIAVLTPLD